MIKILLLLPKITKKTSTEKKTKTPGEEFGDPVGFLGLNFGGFWGKFLPFFLNFGGFPWNSGVPSFRGDPGEFWALLQLLQPPKIWDLGLPGLDFWALPGPFTSGIFPNFGGFSPELLGSPQSEVIQGSFGITHNSFNPPKSNFLAFLAEPFAVW